METKSLEHLDFAIVPKTHPAMYLMHKYWARKPHNVVAEYIAHYSSVGEVVLDPFCGSGVSVLEAVKQGRKAIGVDLDPMAIFITRCTGKKVDLEQLQSTFVELERRLKAEINALFATNCPKCRKKALIKQSVWEKVEGTEPRADRLSRIWYSCEACRKSGEKKPSVKDKGIIAKFESKLANFQYPDNPLIWNTRVNVHKGMKVSDLFNAMCEFQ